MTIEELAKLSGVTVTKSKDSEDSYEYKQERYPNVTIIGFETEQDAYESWFSSTFGEETKNAIEQILREHTTQKEQLQTAKTIITDFLGYLSNRVSIGKIQEFLKTIK